MKLILRESQIKKLLIEEEGKIPPQLQKLAKLFLDPENALVDAGLSVLPAEVRDAMKRYEDNKNASDAKKVNKTKISNNRQFIHPLGGTKNFRITSKFNDRRGNRKHNSVDIAAPTGTPIYAPNDGKIMYAGDVGKRCGGHIKINHGDIITKYCHLSKWVVSPGQFVKKGQLIGYVGGGKNDPHRGVATGSHLHYEILANNNTHINPEQSQFGFA